MSKPLEKDIEKAIGEYAKSRGCLYYKFTSPNQRSVPDRLIISPDGGYLFLEIKRPGQRPTRLQQKELAKLEKQRCAVDFVDCVDDGKHAIDRTLFGEP